MFHLKETQMLICTTVEAPLLSLYTFVQFLAGRSAKSPLFKVFSNIGGSLYFHATHERF